MKKKRKKKRKENVTELAYINDSSSRVAVHEYCQLLH